MAFLAGVWALLLPTAVTAHPMLNLGIELMQVGIIALVILWLYGGLRCTGAVFVATAATAWIIERTLGEPNVVTVAVEQVARQAGWLVAGLALLALAGWWQTRKVSTNAVG